MSEDVLAVLVIIISLLVFGLLGVGLFLVIRDTRRGRGRWGINLKGAICSQCNTPAPTVRVPQNASQWLWGGWTCKHCGLELDKWGQPTGQDNK